VYSLDVGRLVFDYDGNILFGAGSHSFFNMSVPICELLSG
jgi:hypothetical protein